MKTFKIKNIFPAEVISVNYSDSNTQILLRTNVKPLTNRTPGVVDTIDAYPLDSNVKRIPLKGEVVIILEGPKYNSTALGRSTRYYYLPYPINIQHSVQHNAVPDIGIAKGDENTAETRNTTLDGVPKISGGDQSADLGDSIVERDNIFPLQPFEGDVMVEGRFGNSIRFGNTQTVLANYDRSKMPYTGQQSNDPIVILSNGHFEEPVEPGKYIKYKYEDIDKDASSIYLTTTQRIQFNPLSLQNFTPQAQQAENINKVNTDVVPQVLIKTDRIIFSSNTETLMYSAGGIGLSTDQSISLDSDSNIHMNAREIKLGLNPTEQAVLGNKLQEALDALIDEIARITVPTGTGPSGIPVNAGAIRSVKQKVANALSNIVTLK